VLGLSLGAWLAAQGSGPDRNPCERVRKPYLDRDRSRWTALSLNTCLSSRRLQRQDHPVRDRDSGGPREGLRIGALPGRMAPKNLRGYSLRNCTISALGLVGGAGRSVGAGGGTLQGGTRGDDQRILGPPASKPLSLSLAILSTARKTLHCC